MKYIKLKDFVKIDPKPFICGALLSRIMEENINGQRYFYAYSSYKTSKYVYPDDFKFKEYAFEYAEQLNLLSGYHNWEVVKATDSAAELRFRILCDIDGFTKNMLYDFLFKVSTTSEWSFDEQQNKEKKDFIRGFAELRGSVDTTAKFLAQDYFYDSKKELKKATILTDTMNISIHDANFNARELQPQFVSGVNQRNSQFRINLFYYAKEIGFINKYKAKVFENAYKKQVVFEENGIQYFDVSVSKSRKFSARFVSYLNYYTNNIYNKEINENLLKQLRKEMNFSEEDDSIKTRNKLIINTFDAVSPDECANCGTKTTYTKKNGKQYFEIHHVVSHANGKEMDNIANLVKLCPTCHRMMKKGSGDVQQQIKACRKFIDEHEEIYEFSSAVLNEENKEKLAIEIQKLLK